MSFSAEEYRVDPPGVQGRYETAQEMLHDHGVANRKFLNVLALRDKGLRGQHFKEFYRETYVEYTLSPHPNVRQDGVEGLAALAIYDALKTKSRTEWHLLYDFEVDAIVISTLNTFAQPKFYPDRPIKLDPFYAKFENDFLRPVARKEPPAHETHTGWTQSFGSWLPVM